MPRCKECGCTFQPKVFLQKYCLEKDECIAAHLASIKDQQLKDWKKRKTKLNKDLLTVQDWLKIAQQAFNAFIRERDKGKPCVSCLNPKPKKFNCGHFYSSGGHKYLTFDESNCHGQCEYCNSFLSGNLHEYRKNIVERIGQEELDRLDRDSTKTAKWTIHELEELTKEYKQKLKDLKSSK